MPWNAIAYIGSGITLIAFLAAIAAWVIRYRSREKERLIRAAPESERAPLIQDTLEFFRVDTHGLSRDQRYKLAITQIRARSNRFTINAALILALAIVAAFVTIFAIFRDDVPFRDDASIRATPGFDVKIDKVAFSRFGKDVKAIVTYSLFPVSTKLTGESTIFTGMMIVYNNDMIGKSTKFKKGATCNETSYCITAHVFEDLATEPIIVRSPLDQPVTAKREFVIPGSVKNIRVFASFGNEKPMAAANASLTGTSPRHGRGYLS